MSVPVLSPNFFFWTWEETLLITTNRVFEEKLRVTVIVTGLRLGSLILISILNITLRQESSSPILSLWQCVQFSLFARYICCGMGYFWDSQVKMLDTSQACPGNGFSDKCCGRSPSTCGTVYTKHVHVSFFLNKRKALTSSCHTSCRFSRWWSKKESLKLSFWQSSWKLYSKVLDSVLKP